MSSNLFPLFYALLCRPTSTKLFDATSLVEGDDIHNLEPVRKEQMCSPISLKLLWCDLASFRRDSSIFIRPK